MNPLSSALPEPQTLAEALSRLDTLLWSRQQFLSASQFTRDDYSRSWSEFLPALHRCVEQCVSLGVGSKEWSQETWPGWSRQQLLAWALPHRKMLAHWCSSEKYEPMAQEGTWIPWLQALHASGWKSFEPGQASRLEKGTSKILPCAPNPKNCSISRHTAEVEQEFVSWSHVWDLGWIELALAWSDSPEAPSPGAHWNRLCNQRGEALVKAIVNHPQWSLTERKSWMERWAALSQTRHGEDALGRPWLVNVEPQEASSWVKWGMNTDYLNHRLESVSKLYMLMHHLTSDTLPSVFAHSDHAHPRKLLEGDRRAEMRKWLDLNKTELLALPAMKKETSLWWDRWNDPSVQDAPLTSNPMSIFLHELGCSYVFGTRVSYSSTTEFKQRMRRARDIFKRAQESLPHQAWCQRDEVKLDNLRSATFLVAQILTKRLPLTKLEIFEWLRDVKEVVPAESLKDVPDEEKNKAISEGVQDYLRHHRGLGTLFASKDAREHQEDMVRHQLELILTFWSSRYTQQRPALDQAWAKVDTTTQGIHQDWDDMMRQWPEMSDKQRETSTQVLHDNLVNLLDVDTRISSQALGHWACTSKLVERWGIWATGLDAAKEVVSWIENKSDAESQRWCDRFRLLWWRLGLAYFPQEDPLTSSDWPSEYDGRQWNLWTSGLRDHWSNPGRGSAGFEQHIKWLANLPHVWTAKRGQTYLETREHKVARSTWVVFGQPSSIGHGWDLSPIPSWLAEHQAKRLENAWQSEPSLSRVPRPRF